MAAGPFGEHIVLESGQTRVVVEDGPRGGIRLDVTAHGYGTGSAEAGRLVREAVHQARLRHASHIEGGLDASGPTCGAVLEALHRSIGDDLESIAMRRAGSSVLVELDLRPLPADGARRDGVLADGVLVDGVPQPDGTPGDLVPVATGARLLPTQPSRHPRSARRRPAPTG
jgi:hypothetical protein